MTYDSGLTPNHWMFRYRALAGGPRRTDQGEDRLCRALDGQSCAVVEARIVLVEGLPTVLVVFDETQIRVGTDTRDEGGARGRTRRDAAPGRAVALTRRRDAVARGRFRRS